MKKFLDEFKAFAMRGNVLDMAVGIILGLAFGKIVTALVDRVLMPPLGALLGGVDFADKKIRVAKGTGPTFDDAGKIVSDAKPPVYIYWGELFNAIINFAIVAFALFVVIKFMNSLKKKQAENPAEAPPPPEDVQLLREIRDLLAKE
ncbi:MAG: large-conductance mechanosensitive channel protein MscL [Phycisphaeraceae bacterium]|nr:large-conductance mechanosensitive channel protein MscL [Phycisphaeraceae bacterium]